MKLKSKIKKWLITKLAGDTFVLLNATVLYKYYPIYADLTKDPILDKNRLLQADIDTPFSLYDSKIFKTVDDKLEIKEEYKATYNKVVEVIKIEQNKDYKDQIKDARATENLVEEKT